MRRKESIQRKYVLAIMYILIVTLAGFLYSQKLENKISKEITANSGRSVSKDLEVIPCGMTVGIYVETEGVLVVDVGKVDGADGLQHQPSFAIIQEGDYIQSIDGQSVTTKRELMDAVEASYGQGIVVGFERKGEKLEAKIIPIQTTSGEYQIGVWVRDNCQGIGTLTFVTKEGEFAALGHGISDADTKQVMKISEGLLYDASILSIVAGRSGEPGEVLGYIDYHSEYVRGTIENNDVTGIYGRVNGTMEEAFQATPVKIASAKDVKRGQATILSSVTGTVEEYQVEIEECDMGNSEHKDMLVRVTDERLLEATGGILQGMSGSPIIQNGKLVGAVTHVLVNDPTTGYGIFIENMLDAAA